MTHRIRFLRPRCKNSVCGLLCSARALVGLAAVLGLAAAPAHGAMIPDIGGDPVHTEMTDLASASGGWGLTVYSYVFDSTSTSLPAFGLAQLDPEDMLFAYVLDGDDSTAVAVDSFSIANPIPVPIQILGWEDDVVPDDGAGGFDPTDFEAPTAFGYTGSAKSTTFSYLITALDPGEYSVVWYRAEAGAHGGVRATATGAGLGNDGQPTVAGPAALVPEPATIALLALGSVFVLRPRR